ncbi:MAG TPA: hypothetical protein H9745_08535 [Candidatus Agathobaculum stercoravium]|nr:hypothetical protein [Candidatus Agathobaculum stercoravium]
MFGLSTREKLYDLILNTSKNCMNMYISGVQELLTNPNNIDNDEAMNAGFVRVRREYLDEVANNVFNFFKVSSPAVHARLQLLMVSPQICGLSEELFEVDTGLSAGMVYGLCYYAVTNKKVKTYDCSKLSHLQNDLMNQALAKLSENM